MSTDQGNNNKTDFLDKDLRWQSVNWINHCLENRDFPWPKHPRGCGTRAEARVSGIAYLTSAVTVRYNRLFA